MAFDGFATVTGTTGRRDRLSPQLQTSRAPVQEVLAQRPAGRSRRSLPEPHRGGASTTTSRRY